MNIPGLGTITKDDGFDWYQSEPIAVPVLGGAPSRIIVDNYDDDRCKEDFHAAIRNFLSIGPSVLKEAEPHLFRYYQRCCNFCENDEIVPISSAEDVWKHIQFSDSPAVRRRAYGDKGIYVSLSCDCDWEQEHGLQIVFRNGLKVNKVGPYNGHLTNSDAYDDEELEDVIYLE